ncbi:MAG: hypothetical protein Q4C75_03850 [Bergeyella zoohelcum]|nr:hypothetical protein [Bergeyella zoohelcum]
MKLFSKQHLIFSVVTFAIVFLMRYIGDDTPEALFNSLLNAVAGVVGLSVGLFILYKNKDSNPPDQFD